MTAVSRKLKAYLFKTWKDEEERKFSEISRLIKSDLATETADVLAIMGQLQDFGHILRT